MNRPHPSKLVRNVILGAIAVFTVLSVCATVLTPLLATRAPALLLGLESAGRNLLLTRNLPLPVYLGIATLRRVGGALMYYLLGRWYGEDALRWLERKTGGRVLRVAERAVRSAAGPMVFFLPEAVVSVLVGTTRMGPRVYLGVSVAGSITVTLLIRWLGAAVGAPLDAGLHVLARYAVPATGVLVALVGGAVGWQWWRKRAAPREARVAVPEVARVRAVG